MKSKLAILVTGGAGYIGTTLVPMLLERRYEVTVIDKLLFGGIPIIPFFQYPNFHFIKGDIRDKVLMQQAVKGKDVIVHLAAIVGFPACAANPDLAESVNVGGTRTLAQVVSRDQYILFGSTGSNYGAVLNGFCTEETPLRPLTLYGTTKTEAEQIILEETTSTAYRFATAFGVSPRLRLDLLINDFTHQALRQKSLVVYEASYMRTFIHVRDMARSFLHAIDSYRTMRSNVYNVGGNKLNHSKKEVCDMIAKATGAYVHYADVGKDADQRNYKVSYAKVRATGFEPITTVRQGIAELVRTLAAVQISNPHINH
jgi:nucleoside-diphosphate-sugar epimerase